MYKETTILRSPVTGEPLPDASVSLRHDLPGLIRNMKQSNAWARGDLNAMILVKNAERNVMLVALHEGTEIVSYQSNDSITFQIIEGKMEFNTRKTSAAIGMGQVLTLNDKVKYRLTTCEETVLLMSIAKDSARSASGGLDRKEPRGDFWR
jgi:quercetin dioxygenase-like cupin family protein